MTAARARAAALTDGIDTRRSAGLPADELRRDGASRSGGGSVAWTLGCGATARAPAAVSGYLVAKRWVTSGSGLDRKGKLSNDAAGRRRYYAAARSASLVYRVGLPGDGIDARR
jgi:hypothetical protein